MSSTNTRTFHLNQHRSGSLEASIMDEVEQIGAFLDTIKSSCDQASELAELGVLSSMFAHEVNNLMTQVGGRAQLALMHMDQPKLILKALDAACHASTQIAQLSDIFLESTRSDTHHIAKYRVDEIHQRALEFISDQDIERYGMGLNGSYDDIRIDFPPILLQQVLLNIYLNAIRAIEDSSSTTDGYISTYIERIGQGPGCSPWNIPRIRITIEDNGIGMTPKQIERVLGKWERGGLSCSGDHEQRDQVQTDPPDKEPGRGRDRGRGHGLGLAICKKLLSEAGGTIHAESTFGVGTWMIITLPESSNPSQSR